ncbi:hypothetical protein GBAR_LOCUS30539, partial [Geodia barretti]
RCIFWCLRGIYAEHTDRSDRALQRSIFRENPTYFLTFVARWVDGIVSGTNRHSRGEM